MRAGNYNFAAKNGFHKNGFQRKSDVDSGMLYPALGIIIPYLLLIELLFCNNDTYLPDYFI